jgi:hypothetical protein
MPPLSLSERQAIRGLKRRLEIRKSLRQRWRDGLPEEWFRKYGDGFFTARDLYRAAVSQTQYGFPEWFLAVELRKRHGLRSVLKCTVQNDPRKQALVVRLLGRKNAKWLCKHGHRAAPPDLLVYRGRKPLFFAEAKLGRDRLRPNQSVQALS